MKIRFCCAFLCVTLLMLSCVSCLDQSGTGGTIYYEATLEPVTLDPQLADSESERMLVLNCFEGLVRLSAQGEPVLALVDSVEVSGDGLAYTFTLRQDAVWQNGDPVTADDFVFGITRTLMPVMRAPDASQFYAIKNARAVHTGEIDAEQLGITAKDRLTLIIELEKPDGDFLRKLSLPAAMPCNRDFFEACAGRYGLDLKNTLSNGPFSLRLWEDGGVISIRQNSTFSGPYSAKPMSVVISFNSSIDTAVSRLHNAQVDAAKISSSLLEEAEGNAIKTVIYETTCWALAINPRAETVGDESVRHAMLEGLESGSYSSELDTFGGFAHSLIAPDLLVQGERYAVAGSTFTHQTDAQAADRFKEAIKQTPNSILPITTLIYPDVQGLQRIANLIAQNWQKVLGAYINTQALDLDEFYQQLQNGYQIALVPLSSSDGTAKGLLNGLAGTEGEAPLLGFEIPELLEHMESIPADVTSQQLLQFYTQAEQIILQTGTVIPLFYDRICYAYSSNITGIEFFQYTGYISFLNAGRTSA